MAKQKQVVYLGLVLVLLAGAAIRTSGAWFAYPLTIHPDEKMIIESALVIKQTGDLNPHHFNYPSLPIYTQVCLFWFVDHAVHALSAGTNGQTPIIYYFIAARLVNVMLSVLTIFITFEIGRRLVSPQIGLAAALFISCAPLNVHNAFIATVDTPVAFWTSVSILMSLVIATGRRSTLNYVLTGVFIGLAIGCKYTAFLATIPFLLAHLSGCRTRRELVSSRFLIGMLLVPVVFLFTTPFAVLDYTTFWNAIQSESQHYRNGHLGNEAEGASSLGLYAQVLFWTGYGIVPMILAIIGLAWLLRRDSWMGAILISFPLLLLLFVGQYKTFFSRNVLPCIPELAVLSAIGVVPLIGLPGKALTLWTSIESHTKKRIQAVGATIVVLFSVARPAALALEDVRKARLLDSRWASLLWINDNLPGDAHIAREHYTPPIENYDFGKNFEVKPQGYHFLVRSDALDLLNCVDYVVLSSGDFQRFFDKPELYPEEARAYQDFFDNHFLVKEFTPDNTTLGGPHILIYAMQGY